MGSGLSPHGEIISVLLQCLNCILMLEHYFRRQRAKHKYCQGGTSSLNQPAKKERPSPGPGGRGEGAWGVRTARQVADILRRQLAGSRLDLASSDAKHELCLYSNQSIQDKLL